MRTRQIAPIATLFLLLAAGAACDTSSGGSGDTSVTDTGTADSGSADADLTDTGATDTAGGDSGTADSGTADTAGGDSGTTDTAGGDSGATDTAGGDSGATDSGATDTADTSALCPAEEPIGLGACIGDVTCEYGEECCCGECHPSIVCSCSGGTWSCHATDACMIAGCPCHDDTECEDSQGCTAPDDPQACGICMEPESTCTADVDCAETPGTVCDIPTSGCFCEPVPQCVLACNGEQGCAVGETCAEGHCVDTPCEATTDCPTFFSCIQDASGHCARTTCSADADCGDGVCVNGRCYENLGICEYPVP